MTKTTWQFARRFLFVLNEWRKSLIYSNSGLDVCFHDTSLVLITSPQY